MGILAANAYTAQPGSAFSPLALTLTEAIVLESARTTVSVLNEAAFVLGNFSTAWQKHRHAESQRDAQSPSLSSGGMSRLRSAGPII